MPERREAPPIREFADRGIIWLFGRAENLRMLVELVDPTLADAFDWDRAVRINRSLIPEDLRKREADVLYRAPYRDHDGEAIVYLLLEHQSRPEPDMGVRLLGYMKTLWDTLDRNQPPRGASRVMRPPVVSIVLTTGSRRWDIPEVFEAVVGAPEGVRRHVPRFEASVLNLRARPPETLTGSTVAAALRVLREADAPTARLKRALTAATIELERFAAGEEPTWRDVIHFLLLLIQHKRKAVERDELYQIVTESVPKPRRRMVANMIKTGAQELIEQGIERGIEQGIEQGRLRGQRETLRTQLAAKFGPLSDAALNWIEGASKDALSELTVRLLTARSLQELGL